MSVSVTRTLALVGGVVLIVMGAGLVVSGYSETQASQEWNSQMHYCGSTSVGGAGEVDCPDNPHSEGGAKMFDGVVLTLIGGVGARYGTE